MLKDAKCTAVEWDHDRQMCTIYLGYDGNNRAKTRITGDTLLKLISGEIEVVNTHRPTNLECSPGDPCPEIMLETYWAQT